MSFFQAIGLGMKLIGGMQAAKAQEQASRDNAEAMITDRIRGEAQAAQQQVARYQQYFDDIATNEAVLLKNRDFDQSVKSFFDQQKEVTFDDLTIMASQARMESTKQTVASLLEVERGKNQAAATRIRTFSSFASGMHDLQSSMVLIASGAGGGGGGGK